MLYATDHLGVLAGSSLAVQGSLLDTHWMTQVDSPKGSLIDFWRDLVGETSDFTPQNCHVHLGMVQWTKLVSSLQFPADAVGPIIE